MVASDYILESLARLARHEREDRVRPSEGMGRRGVSPQLRAREVDHVRNVHLSDEVVGEPVPAGVDASEWGTWGEEARYVYLERVGVGDELGMDEEAARRRAGVEARMVQAGVPLDSWPLVGLTLETFEARILTVETPRREP